MTRAVLLAHAAATWAMVGVIWMVQLVQYPGFRLVGTDAFRAFHAHHSSRISLIVGPLMLVEGLAALALLRWRPDGVGLAPVLMGLALLAVALGTTMFVSVPLHGVLSGGLDVAAVDRIVATNWIRTVAWTARGALAAWLLAVALR